MNRSKIIFGGAVLLSLLFCGCATNNVSVTSGITAIDQDAIASRPVELPGGYDVDDFRRNYTAKDVHGFFDDDDLV